MLLMLKLKRLYEVTVYHVEHVCMGVCMCGWGYGCLCVSVCLSACVKYVCICQFMNVFVHVCGSIRASICPNICICGVYACVSFVVCRGV
jgi:hypothetical protein